MRPRAAALVGRWRTGRATRWGEAVAVSLDGRVQSVSESVPGSTSDLALLERSGVVDPLDPGSAVGLDGRSPDRRRCRAGAVCLSRSGQRRRPSQPLFRKRSSGSCRVPRLNTVILRKLRPKDSLEEMTALLHRAYRIHADAGRHYVATHQSVEVTRQRVSRGECWVAVDDGSILGTITIRPPGQGRGCDYYEREGVATFQQFAVDPPHQGRGIGRKLLRHAEQRAGQMGASVIAFDTAETAFDLIAMYERYGYAIVAMADWRPRVNYRSVVMAKPLGLDKSLATKWR